MAKSAILTLQPTIQAEARREYLGLTVWMLLLLMITSLPYVFGVLAAPGDRQFMGIAVGVADTAQYFAWLREHHDAVLISNTMTPEPNAPAFFNLLWLALSRLEVWFGLGQAAVFQVLRLVGGLAFGLALYWLYGRLADDRRERTLATALVLVGGGIGWVWVVAKHLTGRSDVVFPFDIYVAEPNALYSLMGYPHFLLAAAFVMATLGLFLAAPRIGRARAYGLAALAALLLGLQHAYDLLMIYGILGGYVLLRWWQARRFPWPEAIGLTVIGLVSSPPAAYFVYLTGTDPIWRAVLAQFANAGVYTPLPHHLLILLGPQLPLAVAALPELWRQRSDADLLLLSWVVIGFGLLYIPADFQIHMLNPYQVPLAILAIRVVRRWARQPGRLAQVRQVAPVGLVVLAALVNIYLLAWRVNELSRSEAPFFLHRDETAALAWIDRQPGEGVVLSSEPIGHFVPSLTGKPAFLAHWAQTVDYYTKRDAVARFFDPATPDDQRSAVVQQYRVVYVLAGEAELERGASTALASPLFEPVFSLPHAVVYRVRP